MEQNDEFKYGLGVRRGSPNPNEFTYGLGARPDPPDPRDFEYSEALQALAAAPQRPEFVDNRDKLGPILDQGKEGACVGFATTGAGYLLAEEILSARWAYEHAKLKDEWAGEAYEGTSVRGAWRAWTYYGVPPWEFWPYTPYIKGSPIVGAEEAAKLRRNIEYQRLNGLLQVQDAIWRHGAVVVTERIHSGWRKPTSKHRIAYSKRFLSWGYHAIVLAGYDDRIGYHLCRNSWGMNWGDGGYAWVSNTDLAANMVDAWLVKSK